MSYDEHLISQAGGDGDTMADVLSAHWSRSTHTDSKPFVDKCDGCGAVVYSWGGNAAPDGIEPLVAHQAAMLSAAGFGKLP